MGELKEVMSFIVVWDVGWVWWVSCEGGAVTVEAVGACGLHVESVQWL